MMPMVFCASLVPWLYERMPEDTSCRRRNHLSTCAGARRRTIQVVTIISVEPSTSPRMGESTMKSAILAMPSATSPSSPSAGSVAPMSPPASACEEDEGRSEEHTSELQSPCNLVCRLLLEKKKSDGFCGRRAARLAADHGPALGRRATGSPPPARE